MNFLLCHGWGFDASYWDNLAPLLAPHTVYRVDLGYFGNPQPFPTSGTWVGIGHSLGLSKLLQTPLNFRALIALNSFLNFLGEDSSLRKQGLQAMIHQFEMNPSQTLSSFYTACGLSFPLKSTINTSLLLDDLNALFIDYTNFYPKTPCLSLVSSNDPIVPLECSLNKNRVSIEQTGHSLGFNHALSVKTKLFEFLHRV